MKSSKHFFLFSILFCFVNSVIHTPVYAQDKSDVITMLNGEQKQGKVISISENSIKFKYTGEDLEYEIPRKDIHKIDFSSGRTEIINAMVSPALKAISASERKGKLAVLPFRVVSNEPSISPDAMGIQIQEDCAVIFKEEILQGIVVQDPMNTNALLAQNNLDASNIAVKPPKDLAELLGVEYVVFGSFDVNQKGTRSYGTNITSYKDKRKKDYDRSKSENKGREIATSTGTTTIEYDAKIGIKIYNDQGNNIYTDSRDPFGNNLDVYHSGLKYMIKRCPFGSKAKH